MGLIKRAALWLPDDTHLQLLLAAARTRHWEVSGIARDWPSLVAMLAAGEAQIGLLRSMRDLPAAREPRLVTLDQPPPPGPSSLAMRRPRWTR